MTSVIRSVVDAGEKWQKKPLPIFKGEMKKFR